MTKDGTALAAVTVNWKGVSCPERLSFGLFNTTGSVENLVDSGCWNRRKSSANFYISDDRLSHHILHESEDGLRL